MKTLKECITEAENKKVAIGHFNISDIEGLWAVFRAAQKLKASISEGDRDTEHSSANVPVIIGVSEGERDFIGIPQVVALVKSIREEFDYPIFLNADHSYSFERVKTAVDAGFDSVIYDGTKLSFEENVAITKQCVEYARSVNPEIIIEGELGYIGTSSKILDELPDGVTLDESTLTIPESAKKFVEETAIDLLAPSVGNVHGMFRGGSDPKLHIDLIAKIREAAGIPLVLHGGSGNSDQDFQAAIANGVTIVHINTELRLAYKTGIQKSLAENPDEVAPYKFMKGAVESMQKLAEAKLRVFNGR